MSCVTKNKISSRDIPEINFPDFPECDRWEELNDNDIKISSDWFIELAKFKIEYEGRREEYNELKDRN